MPTATVLITFSILVVLMTWYRFLPDWRILLLPAFILLAFLASMGPSLSITALNVKYRDFRYVIPFIVQFGLYVSPVGFTSSVVPEEWRLLYSLNPMVGVIDGFRWRILGGQSPLYVPGLAYMMWLDGVGRGNDGPFRYDRPTTAPTLRRGRTSMSAQYVIACRAPARAK